MEGICNRQSERVLRLTLEIIYLLTGEDNIVAKKTSVDGQNPIMVPLHFLLIADRTNDKRILEVTQKIIDLLTAEGSGHKVRYNKGENANSGEKKRMRLEENKAGGSSKRNPPKRCPLDSQNSTQEGHTIAHYDQREDMKSEIKQEEQTYMRDDKMLMKSPGMMVRTTKRKSTVPDGCNTSDRHLVLPAEEDNEAARCSPGPDDMESSADSVVFEKFNDKSLTTVPNVQPSCHSTDELADPPNPEQHIYDHFDAVNPTDHPAEFPFTCSECGKGFKKKKVHRIHVMGHAGKKIYPCSECENLYLTNCGLVAHMKLHAGEKNFKCSECGESFGLKSQLTGHQRLHSRPFSCSECKKTFRRRQQLTRHQRTHTGEKPYSCSECGKSFALRMQLKRHYLVHTGVKPYHCPECWKSFSIKANRDHHLRVHTGERPYTCSYCWKPFARRETLVIHQRNHCKIS